MSKIIPLPNFYKKEEKIKRKMAGKKKKPETAEEIPTPQLIETAKIRAFSAVTALGKLSFWLKYFFVEKTNI